jgi:ubiquinone/menaquinone biosynthesis C-methylase UbiE
LVAFVITLPDKIYGFLKRVIVPKLRYSQDIYQEVLEEKVSDDAVWLDVGCGHHLLPPWRLNDEIAFVNRKRFVVGIDLDLEGLRKHKTIRSRVLGTADELPFRSETFDIVSANMVVEHLDDPDRQFAEVLRVLKPGGIFIFHTVNSNSYFARLRRLVPERMVKPLAKLLDERDSVDVFPVQYKANTPGQISEIARNVGFELTRFRFITSDAVFARFFLFAPFELLLIRILMLSRFREHRTNLISCLMKPSRSSEPGLATGLRSG